MKRKMCIVIALIFCMGVSGTALATPDLMLPFSSGRSIKVTQGSSQSCSDCSHLPGTSLEYGFDFAGFDFYGGNCLGKPIHAAAAGTVHLIPDYGYQSWGNTVIINYGDGTYGRYAHMKKGPDAANDYSFANGLNEGDQVSQGQIIGYCGSTGKSTAPHLHYQTENSNGQSIASSFIDVPLNNGVPQHLEILTSANDYNTHNNFRVGKFGDGWRFQNTSSQYFIPYTKPFSASYHWHRVDENGMETDIFGYPVSTVYKYPDDLNWDSLGADQVWIQDFNVDGSTFTLILNPYVYNIRFDYLGVAYPIHGQIRNYWQSNFALLGAPVTEEYYWPTGTQDYVVQWFEPSDNNYVSVAYQTSTGNFFLNKPEIPQDSNYLNQSALNNANCPDGLNDDGFCGVGGSGYGDGIPVPFPPPTNLVANPLGSSRVEARWDLVQDAVDYQISLYDHSTGNFLYYLPSSTGSITFQNLSANMVYELEAKAIYLDGQSNPTSRVTTATLSPTAPDLASAELLICGDIQNKACVNPQSEFPYTPSSAYIFLALAELHPDPLLFRFDLYDPSENLVHTYDRYGSFNPPGDPPWVTYTENMATAINSVANRAGSWRIEIHYGYDVYSINNFYTNYYFTLPDAPPPPADVPWINTEVVW